MTETRCQKCGYGKFQDELHPKKGITKCQNCPAGKKTRKEGAASISDCVRFCPAGEQLLQDICQKCFHGYYKNNVGSEAAPFKHCSRCPSQTTTNKLGSTTVQDCKSRNYFVKGFHWNILD